MQCTVAALAVKHSAGYPVLHWRGGTNEDGACIDIRDDTADKGRRPQPAGLDHGRCGGLTAFAALWRTTVEDLVDRLLQRSAWQRSAVVGFARLGSGR